MAESMKQIRISDSLNLPALDFVESKIGIIGKSGRGKSGAVKVIIEELAEAGLPFIEFDPVGIAWGIRSTLDGKGEGYPVLVIGGPHGDIPLDRKAGAEIAEAVVKANVSVVIDFSEESKRSYREFIKDFSHRLFAINDTPRMVFIDEAPELVPQRVPSDRYDVYEAVERLVSRGRNKGIGVAMVSQRAATINKDVLTQVDTLMVFGLTSPQDKDALSEWVKQRDEPERLATFQAGLAQLKKQEAWFWAPEVFGDEVFKQIRIRDFKTFHPDRTHLRKAGMLETRPVTIDVTAAAEALMKAMPAQENVTGKNPLAQENERLRHKVKELQDAIRELKELKTEVKEVRVTEVPEAYVHKLRSKVSELLSIIEGPDSGKKEKVTSAATGSSYSFREKSSKYGETGPIVPWTEGLSPGARKALEELARRYPLTVTKSQLATLTGYSPKSGGWTSNLALLKRSGYVEYSGTEIRITESGLKEANVAQEEPKSSREVQEMWYSKLPTGPANILKVLVSHYPAPMSRLDIGEETGYSHTSGGFTSNIAMLKRNGLAVQEGYNLKAADILFPGGEV